MGGEQLAKVMPDGLQAVGHSRDSRCAYLSQE